MKILITGATGFLGGHFAAAAAKAGHSVTALVRRRTGALDALAGDVIVKDMLALEEGDLPAGIDAVVHFASGTSGTAEAIVRAAVEGTERMFAAAKAAGVKRFVHISSLSVYPGPVARDAARPDGMALEPEPDKRGPYAQSKTLAERRVQQLADAAGGGMAVTILRPGLAFGPELASPLTGSAVLLPLGLAAGLGRPDHGVPFVTAEDVSAAILGLLGRADPPGGVEVFDVLSGAPPAKRSFIALHRDLSGLPRRTLWLPGWVARPGAALVDAALSLRGPKRWLGYKVGRMYRFDPAALDAGKLWQAIGAAPGGDPASGLRQTLTIPRGKGAPVAGAGNSARARAQSILAVAAGQPPSGGDGGPIDLVLIGAGRIIPDMHEGAIAALPDYRVRAVVDPNRAAAEAVAARHPGAAALGDIADLTDAEIEGATAVIATPGFTHAGLALDLLGRGAALLMEKPVALNAVDFAALREAAARAGRPVTLFHNYRLRPNTLRLWRFLADHDVGALTAAHVVFHSGRLTTEPARWMREDKAHRVLPLEIGLHFMDIACVLGGPVDRLDALDVTDHADGASTIAIAGTGRTERGAVLQFDLDVSGTARRTQVTLQFERAAMVLDFFPEGFRILPVRATPIDDLGAAARRLGGFAWDKLRPSLGGVPKRSIPHLRIYRHHAAKLRGQVSDDPFSLDGVADTMRTLYAICDQAYPAA